MYLDEDIRNIIENKSKNLIYTPNNIKNWNSNRRAKTKSLTKYNLRKSKRIKRGLSI